MLLLSLGIFCSCFSASLAAEPVKNSEPLKNESNSSNNEPNAHDDTANRGDTVKSWTSMARPGKNDESFLRILDWTNHKVGNYVLRTGKIYGRWVAAMQWLQNNQLVLTEYTPPYEYVTVIDSITGKKLSNEHISPTDVDKDGVPELAFIHEKLNDPKYHMYTVYALPKQAPPKLIWKSGGKFGKWVDQVDTPAGQIWRGRARHED